MDGNVYLLGRRRCTKARPINPAPTSAEVIGSGTLGVGAVLTPIVPVAPFRATSAEKYAAVPAPVERATSCCTLVNPPVLLTSKVSVFDPHPPPLVQVVEMRPSVK